MPDSKLRSSNCFRLNLKTIIHYTRRQAFPCLILMGGNPNKPISAEKFHFPFFSRPIKICELV